MNSDWDWFSARWFSPSTLSNFDWQWPYFLWCIPLLLLLLAFRWLLALQSRQRLSLAIPAKRLKTDPTTWLRFIPTLLLFLALSFMFISLARPQKTSEQIDQWSEGIDIMLVLDISESMEANDLKPNRLEATKERAISFINSRNQDRIGLVIFSGEAISYAPLTTDYDMLLQLIQGIRFKMIEKSGTAIGSSIAVALNRMQESQSKTKVMIVLSDGENNAGSIDPITAANLAYAYNVKIYTIGVGSTERIQQGVDFFGNPVYAESQLDEPLLTEIAKIGQGAYYRAVNNQTLDEIFSRIDRYEKSEVKETRYKNTRDYYFYYLFWGIVCWILWLLTKSTFMTNALED